MFTTCCDFNNNNITNCGTKSSTTTDDEKKIEEMNKTNIVACSKTESNSTTKSGVSNSKSSYSKEDLTTLIAFYKTDVGKKYRSLEKEIALQTQDAIKDDLDRLYKVGTDHLEALKRELAKLGVTSISDKMMQVYHQYEMGLISSEEFINYFQYFVNIG